MNFKFNLTNVIKSTNDIVYTDMSGAYEIHTLNLKLCYRDLF